MMDFLNVYFFSDTYLIQSQLILKIRISFKKYIIDRGKIKLLQKKYDFA